MTLQDIKDKLKAAWHNSPMSLVLPPLALGIYWFTHGHDLHSFKSFPTMGEWTAGIALLAADVSNITDLIPGFNKAAKDAAKDGK